MATRPNFTDAQLVNGKLRIEGVSDDEDLPEIVDIRVVLVQGERITAGKVDQISTVWSAELSATDPNAGDFHTGEAVAFGWETHKTNAFTMTWTEPVTIR
jgi:hypothetical protein